MPTLILLGDVNLMNVDDPAVPFARVRDMFCAADCVFANLECCLYRPPQTHSFHNEGFFADPDIGSRALLDAGISAVGIANNVNYGDAAILGSIARLDAIGLPHTGAGANLDAARAPAVVQRGGLRSGFLQRSSVYWPTNHEAGAHDPGIAVIRGHTAYQVPMHKIRPEIPPMNRPGIPPVIVTWADPAYLRAFTEDIAALRARADVVVASCHWGLHKEVLTYMREIAHAAIDAGADIVIGHGPHYSLAVEAYRGKPIFYGLGSFSFHTGHGGRRHGDWIGMMATATFDGTDLTGAGFRFVRHNDRNETVPCALAAEQGELDDITTRSAALGTRLAVSGDDVRIELRG
ncbi:MAG TPA: CapA family protein [Acetobacteraceae bacterium]|jgi:Bacterial capsule synthesis protein PGA_cap|nr:CapA family protein [Acetobacteraceae bacterium]